LNLARGAGRGCNQPGGWGRSSRRGSEYNWIRDIEIGVIEDVEELGAELQVEPL
jgi:hypothetical protein